jgi:N-acetylglucosaminyldiphosphoundecaprenol N-acetyl-beta-D-mannosaminyltransferase
MATEAFAMAAPALRESKLAPTTWTRATEHFARDRLELAGVLVDRVTRAAAADRIREFIVSGQPHQVVTVNLDFLRLAKDMPEFRAVLNEADLAVADGMPLVWASRLNQGGLPERVAGVELVDETCRLAVELDVSIYLLGAGPGVANAAAKRLSERFPGLRIAGTYSPPFGPLRTGENERVIQRIREAHPGILLVAFGAPRQDLWIRSHLSELDVPVAIGVGCTFDLLAGRVTRAPEWMRQSGLEWAFRLGQEPGRLWRRYANDLPTLARLVGESFQYEGRGSLVRERSPKIQNAA